MEATITPQDVIGKDPFGRFLARLKIEPWQASLLSLSFFLAYMLVLPAFFGVLFPREGLDRSSSVDRVNQIGFWLIHPVVIFFYVWQPAAIARLYRLALPLAPASMLDGLFRASRILHSTKRWWVLGVLTGAVVVYLGVVFVSGYMGARWYSVNWLMAGILQASRFFLFYMVVIVLARHLAAALNLNRVYRHVKLPVLIAQSKYGAAFDAITGYGLSFAGFGAALGFFIAMRNFYGTPVFPEDAIYVVLYLILMPLAFVLPFWQAHVNMQSARLDALRRVSDALQDEYDRLMREISSGGTAEISSERVLSLRALLELTEKAPTWPFENWSIYRVFAATAFPFVMTGLGYLVDFIL